MKFALSAAAVAVLVSHFHFLFLLPAIFIRGSRDDGRGEQRDESEALLGPATRKRFVFQSSIVAFPPIAPSFSLLLSRPRPPPALTSSSSDPFSLSLSLLLSVFSLQALSVSPLAALAATKASPSEQQQQQCPTTRGHLPKKAEFFPGVTKIRYEGPDSKNPLAFRYYNADEVVAGRPMREWLRFSVAFWHTLRGDGGDSFGGPTRVWPWEDASLPELEVAHRRMRAMFEFLDKLGVDYWAFHDRDIAPEGRTLEESNANLASVVKLAKHLQQQSGKKVLWGTAQLFKHARYAHGAATSPNATVFAYAAAQVKAAMDATVELGGVRKRF